MTSTTTPSAESRLVAVTTELNAQWKVVMESSIAGARAAARGEMREECVNTIALVKQQITATRAPTRTDLLPSDKIWNDALADFSERLIAALADKAWRAEREGHTPAPEDGK